MATHGHPVSAPYTTNLIPSSLDADSTEPFTWHQISLLEMTGELTLNKMQRDVMDFHREMGQKIAIKPTRPDPETIELRVNLIDEEARELCDALETGDLVAIAKEACDLLYVVYGTLVSAGIDIEYPWQIVHDSNMLKAHGAIRADGKRMKPEGWQPVEPQIRKALGL